MSKGPQAVVRKIRQLESVVQIVAAQIDDEIKSLEKPHECDVCAAYALGAKEALLWIKGGKLRPSEGILKEVHDVTMH